MLRKNFIINFAASLVLSSFVFAQNSDPVIGTVTVQQRQDTFLVDIDYDVTDLDNDPLIVYLKVSNDSGKTFTIPASTFTGDYGFNIIPGLDKRITWDAGFDYPEQHGESFQVKLIASDINLGHVISIPPGSFSMGDSTSLPDQEPLHDVTLNDFFIAPYAVTNAEYKIFCDVSNYPYPPEGGTNQPPQGYFSNYPNYPVVGVNWYDAVRYCNWLSEKRGYSICYDTMNWSYDSTQNGYHLPTEAQWERASRGNLDQKKYPWGDEYPGTRCNYKNYEGMFVSEMPNFSEGRGTLAVGKFQPNGFQLYDMAGNVLEWCNDWYQADYYNESPSQNPMGPNSGSDKVLRGGAWDQSELYSQCAFRDKMSPATKQYNIGFRIVK